MNSEGRRDMVLTGVVVVLVDGEAGDGNERICEMAGHSVRYE